MDNLGHIAKNHANIFLFSVLVIEAGIGGERADIIVASDAQ